MHKTLLLNIGFISTLTFTLLSTICSSTASPAATTTATTKKEVTLTIFFEGKKVGQTTLPPESKVEVLKKIGTSVLISRGQDMRGWTDIESVIEDTPVPNPNLKGLEEQEETSIFNNDKTDIKSAVLEPTSTYESLNTSIFLNDNATSGAVATVVKNTNDGDTSSQNNLTPSVQEVNKALGLELFSMSKNLWEENPEDVAHRLGWEKDEKTNFQGSFSKGTTAQKIFCLETRITMFVLRQYKNKPDSITITFANKGDYAQTTLAKRWEEAKEKKLSEKQTRLYNVEGYKEAITQQSLQLQNALKELFGSNGVKKTLYENLDYPETGIAWNWNSTTFFLIATENEYTKLRIINSNTFAHNNELNAIKNFVRNRKDNVKKLPNGAVLLTNIPFVTQGPRAYCLAATFERILRYYGIRHIDADRIAVNTTQPGGMGDVRDAVAELNTLLKKLRLTPKNGSPKNGFYIIKDSIDKGIPVIYTNTDPHIQLIVGYNEKTKQIATSDSDEMERKRYLKHDKEQISEIPGHQWISVDNFKKRFRGLTTLE